LYGARQAEAELARLANQSFNPGLNNLGNSLRPILNNAGANSANPWRSQGVDDIDGPMLSQSETPSGSGSSSSTSGSGGTQKSGNFASGTPEHKAQRWQEYKDKKGATDQDYSKWSSQYDRAIANNKGGNFYTDYVLHRQLFDDFASNKVELQVDVLAPNGISVRPDYTFYNQGQVAAYGDAKAGAIVYDDQAKGLISAASQTTSRQVIYYTPTGRTLIPEQLRIFAQTQKVTIKQVRVP
jgi:hypothetical protein